MNCHVIIALSLLVALVASSPCSDECNGSCTIAKTDCDGAMVLGPLCDIAFGQCSAGCNAVCGCYDGCEGQCQPDLDTCRSQAGDNAIFQLECSAQFDACVGQCNAGCAVQSAMDTVSMVLGGGAAAKK